MKILVTGGAGFIGSHIVDTLIKNNHEVIIIDNLSTGQKDFINKSAKLYIQDIRKDVNHVFEKEKPELVIHTAAQVMLRKSIEEPIFDATTNIIGTINILEACRKNNVKKIIYTSTGGARYGEPKYLPVDENHQIKPASPYGISKHTAEHYVEMYSRLYELDYLIFCFGNVYGPRDNPECKRVTSIFSYKILKNEKPIIFGDGNQTRDFIFVKDIANFIVKSINKTPKNKLFNLANGEQISVNQIFEILKEISGFSKDAEHIEAVQGEVRDICLDTKRAKQELGWAKKTDFKEGLRQTFEWLKENYSIFKHQ
ncbi:MAG: NAD-dependent epimerase/dehydratase family protein [Candidatus Pacearchaeota archaeon]|jgi:UDP-glucose 4-epimerase